MLSFDYALTKEDYCNYFIFVTWEAPGKQKKRTRYFLRQLFSILIFTLLFYYTGLFTRDKIFSIVAVVVILFTSVLSLTGIRSSLNKQAQKIADNTLNNALFSPTHLSASDAGILLKDEFTESKFTWRAFVKKQENADYYFLFYSSLEAIIIPKRIFKPYEETLFAELLVRCLSFDAEIGHLIKNI